MTVVICLGCHHESDDYTEHIRHLRDAEHDDQGEAFKRSKNRVDW